MPTILALYKYKDPKSEQKKQVEIKNTGTCAEKTADKK